MRFLDPRELAELAAAHPRHHQPLVLTAGYVGLRRGELAGLRVDRVDLLCRTTTVDQQLIEVGGRLSFGPPKTKAGTRVVSIPARLVDMLGGHFGSEAVQKSGLASSTTTGSPMRRSNFPRRVWKPALAALGWLGDHPLTSFAEGAHPSR